MVVAPELPKPHYVWDRDRLWRFLGSSAKLLLKRVAITTSLAYADEGTVGVALDVSGSGAHLRFAGEGGLHAVKAPDPDTDDNPDVMAKVGGGPLASYRPPEAVVRRGWYRDEPARRRYDLTKGEMHDAALDRVWPNMHGGLARCVAEALAANVRARLLKMIVE